MKTNEFYAQMAQQNGGGILKTEPCFLGFSAVGAFIPISGIYFDLLGRERSKLGGPYGKSKIGNGIGSPVLCFLLL